MNKYEICIKQIIESGGSFYYVVEAENEKEAEENVWSKGKLIEYVRRDNPNEDYEPIWIRQIQDEQVQK